MNVNGQVPSPLQIHSTKRRRARTARGRHRVRVGEMRRRLVRGFQRSNGRLRDFPGKLRGANIAPDLLPG